MTRSLSTQAVPDKSFGSVAEPADVWSVIAADCIPAIDSANSVSPLLNVC
jgi:hypothetical protein